MVKLLLAPSMMLGAAGTLTAPQTGGGLIDLIVAIPVAISSIALIVGVIYGAKYKVAFEAEKSARQGETALNEALDDRIRTFAHEREDMVAKLDQQTTTLLAAQKTISRLEPLNDMAKVLALVTSSFERLVTRQEEMHRENRKDIEERTQLILAAIEQQRRVA